MIELTANSLSMLSKAAKNKGNKVLNFIQRKADGTTEISRMILGKERGDAIKAIRGMIPKDCGKVFCTFT